MSKRLNLPLTKHGFEDMILLEKAERFHIGFQSMPDYGTLHNLLGLDLKSSQDLLKKFSEIDKDQNGKLEIDEFSEALHLDPKSQLVHDLFDIFDSDHCGHIDFREFVAGLVLLNEKGTLEQRLKIAFEVIDENSKHSVDYFEFSKILLKTVPRLSQSEIDSMFSEMSCEDGNSKRIHLDDFVKYFKSHENQALLHDLLLSPLSSVKSILDKPKEQ
jgi:Ca2+-binding EF-hand superfamily protein